MDPIRELTLRHKLGIPDEAGRVLILAESSHWDPDWLYTSEEYYRRFVERNLDRALAALQAEPRRVYSVECVFFLRMYWERRPQQQDLVRQLVNAGLDDYLDLVECHRDTLPAVELDPNPYWTGFYTARPALKHRCYELVDGLLRAERLALAPENRAAGPAALQELAPAWWAAATANHHDFITGTSPDAVVEGEQVPWLEQATRTVEGVLHRLAVPAPPPGPRAGPLPAWSRQGPTVRVETPHYAVELSEEAGGSIVQAIGPAGEAFLVGLSNDLLSYRDTGGLWRMGHEFRGGALQPGARASAQLVPLRVRELDGVLEVAAETVLDGEPVRRTLWFRLDSPLIRGRVEGRAAPGRTVTLLFQTPALAGPLAMAQPGGVIGRPLERVYHPTFWPAQEFAHLRFPNGRGLALVVREPGAVARQVPIVHHEVSQPCRKLGADSCTYLITW
jgi:hypothetical protein